jgi:hypothetical protein
VASLYCDANSARWASSRSEPGCRSLRQRPRTLTGTGADSGASYYAFAFTDANTLYIADDRAPAVSPAIGGGIQKWTQSGGTWTRQGTFNSGLTGAGVRGLAVHTSSAGTVLIATTASASPVPNAIIKYVDNGSFSVSPTTIQATNGTTVYRGVAMSPN